MKFGFLIVMAGIVLSAAHLRADDAVPNGGSTNASSFWSFQPVKDPPVPKVKKKHWAQSPIDYFVLNRLEGAKILPVGPADKTALIRRVTFDLIGLPPTLAEIDAFLRDRSPRAFEKVVDRLLASPHYGERWGRHWLDLARYADTAGDSADFPVPQAYHYRNYVIDSFNHDKPYNQFLLEQIAGDLLPSPSEAQRQERLIATGYVAISRRFGVSPLMYQTIDDTIDNVGKTVLGLTLGCARCHDHKFDPISTKDYYALYGIFSSTRYPQPGCEASQIQRNFIPLATAEMVEQLLTPYQKQLGAVDKELEELGKKRSEAQLAANAERAKLGELDDAHPSPALTNQLYFKRIDHEIEIAKGKRGRLVEKAPPVEMAYAVIDGKPENARVHKHGQPDNLGPEVPRHFPEVLGGQTVPADYKGSGRLQLAQWLTDPKNPLTARVLVNRIWQYHFGKGIVGSPNDFGARGQRPTNPDLLDYLATRFVADGWSIKAMHKLILLSSTYQLSCDDNARDVAVDPGDDLLWKFRRERLDAEEIRDAMLSVSGQLDDTMGGPQPFPPASKWAYTQHYPFEDVYASDKRSIYLMVQRIKKHPFFELFDGADPNSSTAERQISTTPLQALYMMNGDLPSRLAQKFADRVLFAAGDEKERLNFAHRTAWGRPASPDELRLGHAYLQQFEDGLKHADIPSEKHEMLAWKSYALVLFSSDDFLFVE